MTGPRSMSPAFMAARRAMRRFDHDECRRLYAVGGWTQRSLAEHYGVSSGRVQQIINPNTAANVYAHNKRRSRRIDAYCRCGQPMTNASIRMHRQRGTTPRCIACLGLDRATTVHADTLLCTRCDQWKPDAEYPLSRANKARRGRHAFCSSCQAAEKKAWREANPERVKATEAAYRERRNELVRARRAAQRAARA